MSLKKLKLKTKAEHSAKRLDVVLTEWLTEALQRPVSKAKARKLVMAGAVYLDRRRVKIASQDLFPGAEVEAWIDVAKLFDDLTSRDKAFEVTTNHVLFEDEDLIVIDKPSGLPAHPTQDKTRDNLFAAIARFLSKRDRIDKPYVGVHQRLDRDTSGVVLFTKSQRVNAAVGKTFSSHAGIKIYQALTVARPMQGLARKQEQEWTIKNYLGKVSKQSKRTKYGAIRSDGDFAETAFRLIAKQRHGLWIEAIPKTGRTHQIRVHLAEYGLPILGDDLYGVNDKLAPRLMLHAAELIFPHPITQQTISVKSPLPADFKACLRRIEGP